MELLQEKIDEIAKVGNLLNEMINELLK